MKFLKIILSIAIFALLLSSVSCSDNKIERDETENFLVGLQSMLLNVYMSEPSQALESFNDNEPPAPEFFSEGIMETPKANFRKLRDPYGLDTLYGTWEYDTITGEWNFVSPGEPADAILFKWVYLDIADDAHDAELLIDSLDFYEAEEDTLPTSIWVGLAVDGNDLAWLKFGVHYISIEKLDSASLVYDVIDIYQVGASIVGNMDMDTTLMDSMDFVGTVHIWAENLSNGYRVDYIVTRYEDSGGLLVLEDSDGWKMEVSVSEDVSSDPDSQRRNIVGEITKDGKIAATIEGYFWIPEDKTHQSDVTIIFADDSEDDFTNYTILLESFFTD